MTPQRSPLAIITGIALIALPLAAVALKGISTGWLMVLIIFGPIIVLLAGYVLQIVIATQGFLGRPGFFGGATKRAMLAAWLTLAGILLVSIFVIDGGDSGYGSTFQIWLGVYGPNGDAIHAATDQLSEGIFWASALLWIGAYIWLVTEWIIALRRRTRERRATTGK